MDQELKLYVWTDFCRDYTPGLAFAIAHDEVEARKLVCEARGYDVYDWGDLAIYPLTSPIAKCVSGVG